MDTQTVHNSPSAVAARLHRADRQVRRRPRRIEITGRTELEAATVESLAHRFGDQDLATLGAVPDPGGDVHVDAEEVALHLPGGALVHSGALHWAVALDLDLRDRPL